MCYRYCLGYEDMEISVSDYIREAEDRARRLGVSMVTKGDVRPTNIAPVIAPGSRAREAAAFPMKWGFPHPNRDLLVYNARSETATEKSFFATSTEERRCLVPASWYYEWRKADKDKIRYSFSKKGEGLYLGALYIRSSKELIPSFSILTRDAPEEIAFIHKRMPVIVPKDKIADWLSSDMTYMEAISLGSLVPEYTEG